MNIVDFHNHLIPAVDDGAQTGAESIAALKAFAQDGVAVAVTTPHLKASLTLRPVELGRRLDEIDAGYRVLQAQANKVPSIRVARGAELLLDVPDPNLDDARLRLAGGVFFLVEFPGMTVPPHAANVLAAISRGGYTPIIAHPERYRGIPDIVALARIWKERGALLQINGGSLLGTYGKDARRAAFQLLEHGLANYLCSDYHARGRTLIGDYRSLLDDLGAGEHAHMLMQANPSRMLDGLTPLPVAPLRLKETVWNRVAAIFR